MSIIIATYTAPGTPYRAELLKNKNSAWTGCTLYIFDVSRDEASRLLFAYDYEHRSSALRACRRYAPTWKRDT